MTSININELPVVARRVLNVFYVLDVSGSMKGAPISTLNMAMGETIEALKQAAKKNADAIVQVAVLTFSDGCSWITNNGPENLEGDFEWIDVEAKGLTDVGAALIELDSKLSRSTFLRSITGNYLPIIIFMTDGQATDNYSKALEKIRKNKWFQNATKIGFAVGDKVDMNMISEVVGTIEAVIKPTDLQDFSAKIKFASITSTMLRSQSRTPDQDIKGSDIVKIVNGGDESSEGDTNNSPKIINPEPNIMPSTSGPDTWPDTTEW